jgi:hypothetical protein
MQDTKQEERSILGTQSILIDDREQTRNAKRKRNKNFALA